MYEIDGYPEEQWRRAQDLTRKFQTSSGIRFIKETPGVKGRFMRYPREADRGGDTFDFYISARGKDEWAREAAFLEDALASEVGKVVVLGNGMSDLALDVAERYRNGQLGEKPILADLFDYHLLLQDYRELAKLLDEEGLPRTFPESDIPILDAIVDTLNVGNLEAIIYKIGSGNPPQTLQEANLVVNVFGPPWNTIDEQLSLLATGGTLIYSHLDALSAPLPEGYSFVSNMRGFQVVIQRDY